MTVPGTIGGVHHVASVVPDADAAASFHQAAFGWQRLSDEKAASAAVASVLGGILGVSDVSSFRAIMLECPDDRSAARLEFVELETARGPGHLVLPGLHVTSFRVRDIAQSWAHLTRLGAAGVQPPVEITVAGWRMRVASIRQPGGGILELVEFIPRRPGERG